MHIVYMVAIGLACCVYQENDNIIHIAWMELRKMAVSSGEQLPHSGEPSPISFSVVMLFLAAIVCISYIVVRCLECRREDQQDKSCTEESEEDDVVPVAPAFTPRKTLEEYEMQRMESTKFELEKLTSSPKFKIHEAQKERRRR